MRHRIRGRRLGRSPSHLLALRRNMACRLFVDERIRTTVAKAKELRPFAERLITIAKKGAVALEQAESASGEDLRKHRATALHYRRRLMQLLGGKKQIVKVNKDGTSEQINVIDKLLNDIGPRFRERPGGYTRVLKLVDRRLGDAAPLAFIEMIQESEGAIAASAPAPQVEEAE